MKNYAYKVALNIVKVDKRGQITLLGAHNVICHSHLSDKFQAANHLGYITSLKELEDSSIIRSFISSIRQLGYVDK